jgi:SAM-dependent methyltransferase
MTDTNNTAPPERPQFNWDPFYAMVRSAGPSKTAKMVVAELEKRAKKYKRTTPVTVVDLGCGEGRDTIYFLQQGYHVIAVDNTASACAALRERAKELGLACRLTVIEGDLATAGIGKVDVVHSQLTLPYVHPTEFEQVWRKILASLKPGNGLLACNLFGDKHYLAAAPFASTFSKEQADELLAELSVLQFHTVDQPAMAGNGMEVRHHAFDILAARKRAQKRKGAAN